CPLLGPVRDPRQCSLRPAVRRAQQPEQLQRGPLRRPGPRQRHVLGPQGRRSARIAGKHPAALHEGMSSRPADTLKIALAQLNPTVGDVAGNAAKVRRARDEAAAQGADVVAFPELFLSGYPPEDLVLKPAFQAACRAEIEALARESGKGPALLVGTPWAEDGKLYNAYALLSGGVIEALRFKVDLPNYGVFDEK